MAFDWEQWKASARDRLRDWGSGLNRAAVTSIYASLTGAALIPAVRAAQSGELLAVVLALGTVAGGVGGNLLAEQIQRWSDSTEPIDEDDLVTWIAAQARINEELRDGLDSILENLEALAQAEEGLSEADREWFAETLQEELSQLGNLRRFELKIAHERAIITGDFRGLGITGDNNIVVLAERGAETWLRSLTSRGVSADELREATEPYLAYLLSRYGYLDFQGMGVSDRIALRLPLADMYVPLKARAELPERETWERGHFEKSPLRVAGRQVSEEEAEAMGRHLSEPQPVLDLLRRNDGLIILGDPGAGKTTFLKYLTLCHALGRGET